MRRSVRDQLPLVPAPFGHEHVRELQAARAILDTHSEFARFVQADLLAGGIDAGRGRNGMSGEQVLRALVVKQANGFSYEELAFHLADSQSYRAFCLIGFADKPPKKSTLQRNLKQVRAETLERINRALVATAQRQGIEDGRRLRSDATVVETAIHEPTDSSLLVDCVRVLTDSCARPASTSRSSSPTTSAVPSAGRWQSSMLPRPSSACRSTVT
jgi:transposase, IS5 family